MIAAEIFPGGWMGVVLIVPPSLFAIAVGILLLAGKVHLRSPDEGRYFDKPVAFMLLGSFGLLTAGAMASNELAWTVVGWICVWAAFFALVAGVFLLMRPSRFERKHGAS